MQMVKNINVLAREGKSVQVAYHDQGNLGVELESRISNKSVKLTALKYSNSSASAKGPIFRFLFDGFIFWKALKLALEIIKSTHFSFIHINNGGYPGAVGARAFALATVIRKLNAKVIFTVNNMAVPYTRSYRWLQAPVDLVLAKSKIMWITASHAANRQLINVLPIDAKQTKVIRNAIDKPICRCNGSSTSTQVKESKLISLTIGHLETRKGHLFLIEAVNKLKVAGILDKNWRFLIEGVGPLHAELQREITNKNLQDSIQLIGHVDCLLHLYSSADLFLHPSISNEDLPNVISEAMSFGLPIIAFDVGGIGEQISNGENGLICERGDTGLLARAISLVMSDELERNRMGAVSYEKFKSEFAETPTKLAYRALYQE